MQSERWVILDLKTTNISACQKWKKTCSTGLATVSQWAKSNVKKQYSILMSLTFRLPSTMDRGQSFQRHLLVRYDQDTSTDQRSLSRDFSSESRALAKFLSWVLFLFLPLYTFWVHLIFYLRKIKWLKIFAHLWTDPADGGDQLLR